ncbi:hypothetical protein QR680_005269 [Steinernema hermaphroditum]|uniref:G-protein coupled receptors family 1 profile domain-containing protein n=1 Tax=Steinernema hermaphroditum TaxID=289476 RepID=A0AA39HRD7_9BILA|nr:hypothetical protein QR680_005269 [Steinernema hermaphroditum]
MTCLAKVLKSLISFGPKICDLATSASNGTLQGMHNSSLLQWYSEQLTAEDVFAGGSLLLFAIVFLPLYAIVAAVMYRNDRDIIGFRFLFSAAIADMVLLFNYSLWPALTILFKSEIISPGMRPWVQLFLDFGWFSMCFHYPVISWSRFTAIRFPNSFRTQPRAFSYAICGGCYVAALVQVLATHFQPWYVVFYFEPSNYGMLSENFEKYLTEGQSLFFCTFHILMMLIPFFFYSWAIVLLLRKKKRGLLERGPSTAFYKQSAAHTRVEARLIIPCICNTVVFIVGQVVITVGTGEGKWATWSVLLLFSANSAVNPILLLSFSAVIRRKFLHFLGLHRPFATKYLSVPIYRNSTTPSPQSEHLSPHKRHRPVETETRLLSRSNSLVQYSTTV